MKIIRNVQINKRRHRYSMSLTILRQFFIAGWKSASDPPLEMEDFLVHEKPSGGGKISISHPMEIIIRTSVVVEVTDAG